MIASIAAQYLRVTERVNWQRQGVMTCFGEHSQVGLMSKIDQRVACSIGISRLGKHCSTLRSLRLCGEILLPISDRSEAVELGEVFDLDDDGGHGRVKREK